MGIEFKDGVDAGNVHPAIWVAVGIAYLRHLPLTMKPLCITAMQGTDHMHGSYHDAANTPSKMCQAVDFRTNDIVEAQRFRWAEALSADLEPLGYDVIHHHGQDAAPVHLHVEYQPKAFEVDFFLEAHNALVPNRTAARQL